MTYLTIVLAFVVCLSLASKSQVIVPPHLEMNEPEVIRKGQEHSFSLKCVAAGVPTPNVTWFKTDGTMMADSNENGILLFDGFSRRQAGKYQCVASNPYGKVVSNFVELKYAFLGDFQISGITAMLVDQGDSITLLCLIQIPFSEPEPVFFWKLQDTLDTPYPKKNILVNLDSRVSVDKNGNLRFAHVTEEDHQDGWYYMCVAWNADINYMKMGCPTKVIVQSRSRQIKRKPKISYSNAAAWTNKVKVIEGDRLDLYCIFVGYPTPGISWSKVGGLPISDSLSGGTRLLVENVKNNNLSNGIYTCIGMNSEGRTKQNFDVEVLMKPKFIVGPNMVKNINVTEGSDVEFICDVVAKPPAYIKWLVNNIEIEDGDTSEPKRTISGNRFKMTNLQKGNDQSHSDIQVVTCEASNFDEGMELGTRFSSGYINVVD